MSDTDNIVLQHLRAIRADVASLKVAVAKIERRTLAIELNISRIRRENAGDTETAMATILDHDERLARIEEQLAGGAA